jgi:hypothetical protein
MSGASDDRFLAALRAILDRRAETLAPEVRARLARARRTALNRLERPRFGDRALVPAAVFGCALALLIVFNVGREQPELAPALEDLDLLSATEALEMYDDLDFYLWLETLNGAPG